MDSVVNEKTLTENGIELRFSKVSLFGVGDLDTLKLNIFEELRSPSKQATSKFKRMGKMPSKWRRLSKFTKSFPLVGKHADTLAHMYFSDVRNAIVCFDDIERRNPEFSLRMIFGLALFLRDNRNCRVLFLLNKDDLVEDDQQEFDRYFEKTFDGKITLNPSAIECCDIAFGEDKKYSSIKSYALKLPISNIRILKKTVRLFDEVFELSKNLHSS
ncbi:MAG: hypothetical protein GYB42_07300, partial [Alphaproteobacteria bacterium]|nr:hypothetical protein [Alphaproteobacteria bacterium]